MFYIRDYSYKFVSSDFTAENKNLTMLMKEVHESVGRLRIDGRWDNNRKYVIDRFGFRTGAYVLRIGCKACLQHPRTVNHFIYK